jgi:hypothetical protein
VTLPPGRFSVWTKPVAIGSAPISKTIGIVAVADFAASAEGAPPGATITATGLRANSAASAGSLSCRPSAQRNWMATLWPSKYPASPRPWRKASTRLANAAGVSAPRYPIVGIPRDCAQAASGHVPNMPPNKLMNWRRLISTTGFRCPITSANHDSGIRTSQAGALPHLHPPSVFGGCDLGMLPSPAARRCRAIGTDVSTAIVKPGPNAPARPSCNSGILIISPDRSLATTHHPHVRCVIPITSRESFSWQPPWQLPLGWSGNAFLRSAPAARRSSIAGTGG